MYKKEFKVTWLTSYKSCSPSCHGCFWSAAIMMQ